MRSSAPLYDALAAEYDAHFAAPNRRAYDELAWEICASVVGPAPVHVVDVGCGVGRWAARLVAAGHRVTGIEPAPAMAAAARARLAGSGFTLVESRVEEAVLPAGSADVVLAAVWVETFNIVDRAGLAARLCARLASQVVVQRPHLLTRHRRAVGVGELW